MQNKRIDGEGEPNLSYVGDGLKHTDPSNLNEGAKRGLKPQVNLPAMPVN